MSLTSVGDSGWSRRALGVVIGHSLLLQALTFCLRPSLSYAALDAGLDVAWLGVLSTAFALPGLALALPAGTWTDRFGERAVGVTGAVAMVSAAALAVLLRDSVVVLVLATALFGTGHLLSVVADQALLANRTSALRRDSVFGTYAFSISLGQALGAGLLSINAGSMASPDLSLQFTLCLGIGAAGLVLAALMRRSAPQAAPGPDAPVGVIGLLRRPNVLRAIVASSLVVSSIEISLVYFPALGYERGFPVVVVSAMLVARSVASMLSRIGLSWWIGVLGRRRLMVGSVTLSALSLAALALPLDGVWTIVLCCVFGFVTGASQPLTLSWLSEIAPPGRRGMVMSLRIGTVRIAQAALPVAVGTLSGVAGAGGVLLATAGVVGVAAWLSRAIGSSPPPGPAGAGAP
ncbi:Predicted arabinose efflux permease, MFS family [Rathayibacter oskolensis]|uniref:Predicted arabinose efflux permease, MFS family n=1 Tax=Rathayibacter oskolensis TaxID=1891671 RepID=A0A1X7PGK3_9MICO|nr:MFS transporter [Rathayibacter oskolensis]SMH50429.1 Predicted arabinose efflux permease, MFS family [Rathayibacter oskolensis]